MPDRSTIQQIGIIDGHSLQVVQSLIERLAWPFGTLEPNFNAQVRCVAKSTVSTFTEYHCNF
jgi:hypothetical protein